ncbi:MAG: hypothetical protein ABIZ04_09420 [Opitutus sp.]
MLKSYINKRERIELVAIAAAVLLVGATARFLPRQLTIGQAMVIGCLAWLVQGGVRDLWLLYQMKRQPASKPARKLACMCVESTLGMTGLLVGISLALSGVGGELHFTTYRWVVFAAFVFTLGFVVKDYVFSWRPVGLRRDPEHHSIIFTWW